MKNDPLSVITLIAVLLTLCLAAGCGTTDASRFYLLTPEVDQEIEGFSGLSLGLGPIHVPDYLDRPQIVTRSGGNEILLAEYDRWAEPLQANLIRVLSENLSRLLGTDRITHFPWDGDMDVRIAVEILRFDADEEGTVTLTARTLLDGGKDSEFFYPWTFEIVKTGDESGDYPSLVLAHSEALASLCRDIADRIPAMFSMEGRPEIADPGQEPGE